MDHEGSIKYHALPFQLSHVRKKRPEDSELRSGLGKVNPHLERSLIVGDLSNFQGKALC